MPAPHRREGPRPPREARHATTPPEHLTATTADDGRGGPSGGAHRAAGAPRRRHRPLLPRHGFQEVAGPVWTASQFPRGTSSNAGRLVDAAAPGKIAMLVRCTALSAVAGTETAIMEA